MDDDFVLVDRPNPQSSPVISSWLQPTAYRDPASDFHKHLGAHVPGTGDWIEKTPQYEKWHDTDSNGILWIKAIAGAGKSVLIASRIARLQQHEPRVPVLFFFFRQIVTACHESHALVRDWLDQLLPHSPYLQQVLSTRKEQSSFITETSFAELWQILTDALLAMPTRVYCVADALDELDDTDAQDLFRRLVALGSRKPDRIKVLVSSRPLPQVQAVLGGVLSVRLEDRLVNRDIACSVQFQLDLAKNIIAPAVRDVIIRSIEDRVFPSFLYARLMMNELLEEAQRAPLDAKSVASLLRAIPASLEDLYSQMLNDYSRRTGVPRERQILILQLATHATRPLRLLEIATAWEFLNCNSKNGQTKQENSKSLTRMSCGPLLEILPDETVSIIHHSFTEFLTDTNRANRIGTHENTFPIIENVEANHQMALICVRYLLSRGLTTWKRQTVPGYVRDPWRDIQRAQLNFPFIDYAVCNWFIHVSRLPEIQRDLLDLLNIFTRPENPSYLAFVEIVMKVGRETASMSPLHVCAWGHMTAFAKALTEHSEHGCGVNALDGQKKTPLTRAAAKGFPDMVSLLLENGATPNPEPDCGGRRPLHYAAQMNHHCVVQLLLEAGADPVVHRSHEYDPPQCCGYMPGRNFESPLEYACQAGAVQSVRAMLPYLAVQDLKLALQWSIEARQAGVVELLVDLPGVYMTEKNFIQDCLILATQCQHPGILQMFINLSAKSGYDILTSPSCNLLVTLCSPLRRPKFRFRESTDDSDKCLDIILRTGCDVNSRSTTGLTALHLCVVAQAPAMVEKLLEHGADVHAVDQKGNTPLHLLKPGEEHHEGAVARIIHALTRAGAKWDMLHRNHGRSPLLTWCTQSGFDDLNLDMLQHYVTDWNIADEKGNTPMHLLLKTRATKNTLQKLVSMGADPNWRNNEGCTPLHCTRDIDQVRLLVDMGADLEARDNHGRTLFLRTVITHDRSKGLAELLDLSANIHATDNEGNGVLHLLCKHRRRVENLRVLLDAGADPLHLNQNSDTLWHVFMRHALHWNSYSLVSMVYMLRRRAEAISLSRRNHDGQTLLHCMCSAEAPSAERLLDPRQNPIDHLPAVEIKAMLEVEDNQGRRPIHLAAGCSEALVHWLIRRGATLTGNRTCRGENVLHIAAAARDSNTLGLLLESYPNAEQRQGAINEADQHGHTPLHIACRSGRVESAMLLLEAGADVTRTDKKRGTPLHACAEFKRQLAIPDSDHSKRSRTVQGEDDTLRVTEIVRALLAHGADPFAQDDLGRVPLDLAVGLENAEMVVELAGMTPRHPRPEAGQLYLSSRDEYIETLINNLTIAAEKTASMSPNQTIVECEHLLKEGGSRVLEQMVGCGVKMSQEQVFAKHRVKREDFIQTLARWGFTHLFEALGKSRHETDWIDGAMSRPFITHDDLPPLIFTASTRQLPNLKLLQMITETFHADVNIRAYENVTAPLLGRYVQNEPHRSALHILAVGNHWWQTDAIRYLLQHGADVTMRNAEGQTPLHIAVRGGYRRLRIAAVLLEHGADPNAFDKMGVTPLAFAVGNSEMVQLLLRHGAKFELGSKPVLFEAISVQDIETVRIILENGFHWSELPFKQSLAELDQFEKRRFFRRWGGGESEDKRIQLAEEMRDRELRLLLCQPVHYAAHGRFNQVAERAKAVEIVELLLAHGADPFCSSGDATMTIHDVFNQGGIVEPFLALLTESDLERRDGHGRTLLLAACEVGSKQDQFQSQATRLFDNLEPHPTASTQKAYVISRLCEMGADLSATDEKGNNVLHLLVAPVQHGKPSAGQSLSMMLSKCPPTLIHQMNQQGDTPLHITARAHRWEAVRLLVDAGADLIPDSDGNSLLHHLAGCLRETNKSPRWMTSSQRSPPEDLWVDFSRLLDRGLDINARNKNGDTPLFKYMQSLSSQPSLRGHIMDRFLAAGADVLAMNSKEESLLHVAAKAPGPHSIIGSSAEKMFVDSFRYLIELGLDPFHEDDKQRTPVDIAAAFGKEDILALFKK